MKKLLLTSALCALSTTASAGPLLDQLTAGSKMSSSYEDVTQKRESYTDLSIEMDYNTDLNISSLTLTSSNGVLTATAQGVEVLDRGKSVMTASGFDVTLDEGIFTKDFDRLLGASDQMTNDVCVGLDVPTNFEARDIEITEKSDSVVSLGKISLQYDIIDPEHDCVVDMALSIEDVSGADSSNMPVLYSVDNIHLSAFTGLLLDKAPRQTSKAYTQDMSVRGVSVSVGGAEQVALKELSSTSTLDPESLGPLANSVYASLVDELVASEGRAVPDVSRSDIRSLWDGIRALETKGDLRLDELKIVGGLAAMMTGEDILEAGRQLDMSMSFEKNGSDMAYDMDLSLSDVVEAGLGVGLVMNELPAGLEKMPLNAILTSLPINISSFEFGFKDMSLGDRVQEQIGMDMYAFAAMNLGGLIGPEKAEIVKDWLVGAKTGGAYFSATPMTPLAPIQIVTGAMGDWSDFGQMIGAKTSKN